MSLTGRRYHKLPHSVRPEPVEGRKLQPMIERAKHSSAPLRINGGGTRQSHCNDVLLLFSVTCKELFKKLYKSWQTNIIVYDQLSGRQND